MVGNANLLSAVDLSQGSGRTQQRQSGGHRFLNRRRALLDEMPYYGNKISPSLFSRFMSRISSQPMFSIFRLIILGQTFTKHNKNLINVFDRLRKVNLKINPKKWFF